MGKLKHTFHKVILQLTDISIARPKMNLQITILITFPALFLSTTSGVYSVRPRFVDLYAKEYMTEDINDVLIVNKAAPNCATKSDPYALGWIYFDGSCYLFTSKHTPFKEAESVCEENGAIMAEIYTKKESNFIKSVLNAINPKDGTDYFLGGIDAINSKEIKWQSGHDMTFKDFINGEPKGKMYLHQDYDLNFRWNTKNEGDQDNGFICKRPQETGF